MTVVVVGDETAGAAKAGMATTSGLSRSWSWALHGGVSADSHHWGIGDQSRRGGDLESKTFKGLEYNPKE